MTRAKTMKARIDERRYPVRIRIAAPPGGFGPRHADMIRYLDQNCGRDGWAEHPAYRTAFPINAVFIYFSDAAGVAPFLDAFKLETVEIVERLDESRGELRLRRHDQARRESP